MTKHYYNIKLDIPQDADSAKYFVPEGYTAKFEDGVLIIEPEKSEDERIRKVIADAVFCNYGDRQEYLDVLAWLEKQKEQKPNYCHFGGDPNIERCRCCSATCSGRLADEQKLAECSEVELTFRGEKVKVKRQFFRDDKGRGYSTTEQDEDAAWYALRAWCEKKGVSLYDLYPREEWSEEDEKMRELLIAIFEVNHPNDFFKANEINTTDMCGVHTEEIISWLKSLRPQPHKEIYQAAKHDLAIKFMNYLDENRPEGKMCLSNGECEDIDKAFKENDWAKIMRYVEKYRPHWKPSEEQMRQLGYVAEQNKHNMLGQELMTLYNDLKKLM